MYLKTNLAVVGPALDEARHLWMNDTADKATQILTDRQEQKKTETTTGEQIVANLKNSSGNDASNYVDRTTIAFSAAYLDYYANHLHTKYSIKDKHLPKLLLKIAKEHTKRERGDKLTLKAYDTNGHFLRDTMRSYITHTKKTRHWKVGNLKMIWNEIPTLVAMSRIVTANMSQCSTTYGELRRHGLHFSPFEMEGSPLGYFCGAGPLFNYHYGEAISQFFHDVPPYPKAGASPCIPLMAYADPILNAALATTIRIIREVCHADLIPPESNDTADPAHQQHFLRYHNAITMALMSHIAGSCERYMKAPTAEMRLLWAEDIERCREHFQTAAAQGWLDTTPQNSTYSASHLRTRYRILLRDVRAFNQSPELRAKEFHTAVHDAEGALGVLRRQCARIEGVERAARDENDGQEMHEDAVNSVAAESDNQDAQ
jgi:hypothetical protein